MNDTADPGSEPGVLASYLMEIRDQNRTIKNWVTFLGVLAALGLLGSIIIGIIIGVQVGKVNQNLNNSGGGGGSVSNCMSLGGTDPSC